MNLLSYNGSEELATCTNALTESTTRYQNLQEEHKKLQITIQKLLGENEVLKSGNQGILWVKVVAELKELVVKSNELSLRLKKTEEASQSSGDIISNLRKEKQDAEILHKQKNESISKELDILQEKLVKLEAVIRLLEEENSQVKEERDAGARKCSILQTQLSNTKNDFNALKKDFDDLSEKLFKLVQEVIVSSTSIELNKAAKSRRASRWFHCKKITNTWTIFHNFGVYSTRKG